MKEFIVNSSIFIGFLLWIALLIFMQKKQNEEINKLNKSEDDHHFEE
jgi:hypothetical protein